MNQVKTPVKRSLAIKKRAYFIYHSRGGAHMDSMDSKKHWEHLYRAKAPTEVSWYQPEA
jgi:hypothetical protein